jgi:hypothetical protein
MMASSVRRHCSQQNVDLRFKRGPLTEHLASTCRYLCIPSAAGPFKDCSEPFFSIHLDLHRSASRQHSLGSIGAMNLALSTMCPPHA